MPYKKKLLLLVSVLLFLLTATVVYINIKVKSKKEFPFGKVRQPKLDIEVTNKIGWWASQDSLFIDSFKVRIVESNLNLFKAESIVEYEVYAKINSQKNWEPEINSIHVSERIAGDSNTTTKGLIEITPIVSVINDEGKLSHSKYIHFKNEIIISSLHWGTNTIDFICLDKHQAITFFQNK